MPNNGARPVRSYVLRQGRLTRGQKQALTELWPAYGVEYQTCPLDFSLVFGRVAPLVVEIGFGNGDALVEMAANEPGTNFLGIEVHLPGVGALLRKLNSAKLENVRVISRDAVDILQYMCDKGSISGLRLYFPDPWPKKRHHKRRLVKPGFICLLADKMMPGAVLHMATDWQNYAEQMLEVLLSSDDFENTCKEGGYKPRPAWRPETHFEQRGKSLGHGVWDLVFIRRYDIDRC